MRFIRCVKFQPPFLPLSLVVKSISIIHFSDEQLFYLGYALPWCAVHTEALMRNHVIKDEHAPDRFRVIGPLSNSEKFARAWSCPNDGSSKMNPQDKCKVW